MHNKSIKTKTKKRIVMIVMAFSLINFLPFSSNSNIMFADSATTEVGLSDSDTTQNIEMTEDDQLEKEVEEESSNQEDSVVLEDSNIEDDNANKPDDLDVMDSETNESDEKKLLNDNLTAESCVDGDSHTQDGLTGVVVCNSSEFTRLAAQNDVLFIAADIVINSPTNFAKNNLTILSKDNVEDKRYTLTVNQFQNINNLTIKNLNVNSTSILTLSGLLFNGLSLNLDNVNYSGGPVSKDTLTRANVSIKDSNITITNDQGVAEGVNLQLLGNNSFNFTSDILAFSMFRITGKVTIEQNSKNYSNSKVRLFYAFVGATYPNLEIKEGAELHVLSPQIDGDLLQVRSLENNGLINIEASKTFGNIINASNGLTNKGEIIITNYGNASLINANIINTSSDISSAYNLYSSNSNFFSNTPKNISTQQANMWVSKTDVSTFKTDSNFSDNRIKNDNYDFQGITLNNGNYSQMSFGNLVLNNTNQHRRDKVVLKTNPNACLMISLKSNTKLPQSNFDCNNDLNYLALTECIVDVNSDDVCFAKADSLGNVDVMLPTKLSNGQYEVAILKTNLYRIGYIKYDIEGALSIVKTPSNINFGTIELNSNSNTVYNRLPGDDLEFKIDDFREFRTGWRLSAYLKYPLSIKEEDYISLNDSLIFKTDNNNKVLKTGISNRITIIESTGDYDAEQNFTFNNTSGILLLIDNYSKVLTNKNYNTEIVWILEEIGS